QGPHADVVGGGAADQEAGARHVAAALRRGDADRRRRGVGDRLEGGRGGGAVLRQIGGGDADGDRLAGGELGGRHGRRPLPQGGVVGHRQRRGAAGGVAHRRRDAGDGDVV